MYKKGESNMERQLQIFMQRTFGDDWHDKTIAELLAECPIIPDHTLLHVLEHYREIKAVEQSIANNAEEDPGSSTQS